eukprot:1083909-Pelagomonas_calceolata.AAC.4
MARVEDSPAPREEEGVTQETPPPIVRLNVGGTIFTTSNETLSQVLSPFPCSCSQHADPACCKCILVSTCTIRNSAFRAQA